MGKSQESFSKKEKEKKRLKKKQDKLQKKEDRKSNSDTGKKTLEEMFAYVDEYGNITSTPPDPTRKRSVKSEDIQVGISRQQAPDPSELIRKGTVTFFNDAKGFGFIKDHVTQDSVFVHVNALQEQIKENDKVTFETERSPKGLSAIRVKLVH